MWSSCKVSFFISKCILVSMHICVHIWMPQRPEKAIRTSKARVTGSCELLDTGSGREL